MEPLEPKLKGRVALVTGAARGLGRSHVLRLARLGADVVVCDIDLQGWREFDEALTAPSVADECRAMGVRAIEVEADLTDRAQVDAMVERTVAELGSVDILVNNAGGMLRPAEHSSAAEMSEDDLRYILDINLMTTIHCCQAAVPTMRERGWGRIVNTSSQAGVRGSPSFVNYGLAKAGVIHYTRCLAVQAGPWGIHVNALAPALIHTSRADAQFPGRDDFAGNIPLRRVGVPEDVSKVVEFLVTDLSDYVTGQVIGVCGGVLTFPI
ncbi:MAG: SDR family oxidoreductase [Armatimonadetes bacterium]|nr:SDR family oxidoreductase [Armatimonadota bacterium]